MTSGNDGCLCAAVSELLHLGNDVVCFAEVDELSAERLDEFLLLLSAVNSDDACAGAETVLCGVLA